MIWGYGSDKFLVNGLGSIFISLLMLEQMHTLLAVPSQKDRENRYIAMGVAVIGITVFMQFLWINEYSVWWNIPAQWVMLSIYGFLADAGQGILCGVIAFQECGNGFEGLGVHFFVHGQGNSGEFYRLQTLSELGKCGISGYGTGISIINTGFEITVLDSLHKPQQLVGQHFPFGSSKSPCGPRGFHRSPVTELLGHDRGKAGQCSVDGFGEGRRFVADGRNHFHGSDSEGI